MKIVAYEGKGRPAIGVQLEDGVLPTGHVDPRTLIEALGTAGNARTRASWLVYRTDVPGAGKGTRSYCAVDRTPLYIHSSLFRARVPDPAFMYSSAGMDAMFAEIGKRGRRGVA